MGDALELQVLVGQQTVYERVITLSLCSVKRCALTVRLVNKHCIAAWTQSGGSQAPDTNVEAALSNQLLVAFLLRARNSP